MAESARIDFDGARYLLGRLQEQKLELEAERDELRSIYYQHLVPAIHFSGRDEGENLVRDLTAALDTLQDYIDTVQSWLNRFQQTTLDLAASVNQIEPNFSIEPSLYPNPLHANPLSLEPSVEGAAPGLTGWKALLQRLKQEQAQTQTNAFSFTLPAPSTDEIRVQWAEGKGELQGQEIVSFPKFENLTLSRLAHSSLAGGLAGAIVNPAVVELGSRFRLNESLFSKEGSPKKPDFPPLFPPYEGLALLDGTFLLTQTAQGQQSGVLGKQSQQLPIFTPGSNSNQSTSGLHLELKETETQEQPKIKGSDDSLWLKLLKYLLKFLLQALSYFLFKTWLGRIITATGVALGAIRVLLKSKAEEALKTIPPNGSPFRQDDGTIFVYYDNGDWLIIDQNGAVEWQVGGPTDSAPKRNYAPSPKHSNPNAFDPNHSYMDLDDQTAQEVLDKGIMDPDKKQVYSYYNGKIYEFQPDNAGSYHGYPISGGEAPSSVLRVWLEQKIITQSDYNRLTKQRKGKQ